MRVFRMWKALLPRCTWQYPAYSKRYLSSIQRSETRIKFDGTSNTLQSVPSKELWRSWLVYQMFNSRYIVENSEEILAFIQKRLPATLFTKLIKSTIYGQFVGGEDIDELHVVIERMKRHGVLPILDYAVEEDVPKNDQGATSDSGSALLDGPVSSSEGVVIRPMELRKTSARPHFYTNEDECDKNVQNFLSCIKMAADTSEANSAFAAIKVTALGKPEFLLQFAKVLTNVRKSFLKLCAKPDNVDASALDHTKLVITPNDLHGWLVRHGIDCSLVTAEQIYNEMDSDKNNHVDILDWVEYFRPDRDANDIIKRLRAKSGETFYFNLSPASKGLLQNMTARAHHLAKYASDLGVRIMVDAEQTYYQAGIRHVAVNMLMPVYNYEMPGIVYNTIQCYLKNALTVCREDIALARRYNFHYGVKLVRGAYLEQERSRAVSMGYEDPIHPTKEATDNCYHKAISYLIEEVSKSDKCNVMVASHNEESVRHAVKEMTKYGISTKDGRITFGQLYGMYDHISLMLGQHGYKVYKYLPYGPVKEVLPYLIRRANENSGVLARARSYQKLLSTELKRRYLKFADQ